MASNSVVFTEGQLAEIIRLYADGKPLVWIAAKMGCSEGPVRMALARANIEVRKPGASPRKAV